MHNQENVFNEIIQTERSYLRQLETIIKRFADPIEAYELMSKEACDYIFDGIRKIFAINLQLLELMQTDGIPEAFLKMAPYLRLYSCFASRFIRILNRLSKERSNRFLNNFISFREMKSPLNGLKLESLLITPIQRIPRYRMLLRQLVDHPCLSPEKSEAVKSALQEISFIAQEMNDSLPNEDVNAVFRPLNNRFNYVDSLSDILSANGEIIKQGRTYRILNNVKLSERYIYLSTDSLTCVRQPDGRRPYCSFSFPLRLLDIIRFTPDDCEDVLKLSCNGLTVLLMFDHPSETSDWFIAISDAIKACREYNVLKRIRSCESDITVYINHNTRPFANRSILESQSTDKQFEKWRSGYLCRLRAQSMKENKVPLGESMRRKESFFNKVRRRCSRRDGTRILDETERKSVLNNSCSNQTVPSNSETRHGPDEHVLIQKDENIEEFINDRKRKLESDSDSISCTPSEPKRFSWPRCIIS